jgi:hypothetical protein
MPDCTSVETEDDILGEMWPAIGYDRSTKGLETSTPQWRIYGKGRQSLAVQHPQRLSGGHHSSGRRVANHPEVQARISRAEGWADLANLVDVARPSASRALQEPSGPPMIRRRVGSVPSCALVMDLEAEAVGKVSVRIPADHEMIDCMTSARTSLLPPTRTPAGHQHDNQYPSPGVRWSGLAGQMTQLDR